MEGGQYVCDFNKGFTCNQAHILVEVWGFSWGADISANNFRGFPGSRRCKKLDSQNTSNYFRLVLPDFPRLIPDLHHELLQGVLKSVTAVASDFILVELKSKKHLLVVIMCVCQVILVTYDSATLWTIAHQAPMSMGFSRQDYWSRLSMPSYRGSFQPKDPTWVSYLLH